MAEPREDAFVDALIQLVTKPPQVRSIISLMRTLGYINEIQYSAMNTRLSEQTITIRGDGSETIELARLNMHIDEEVPPLSNAIKQPMDPEDVLPREY